MKNTSSALLLCTTIFLSSIFSCKTEKDLAKAILIDTEHGSMPEEIAKTRPLFYSIYNLHAMFLLPDLTENVGVDIWEANENHSGLKAGLDYVAPYAPSE